MSHRVSVFLWPAFVLSHWASTGNVLIPIPPHSSLVTWSEGKKRSLRLLLVRRRSPTLPKWKTIMILIAASWLEICTHKIASLHSAASCYFFRVLSLSDVDHKSATRKKSWICTFIFLPHWNLEAIEVIGQGKLLPFSGSFERTKCRSDWCDGESLIFSSCPSCFTNRVRSDTAVG